MMPSSNRVSLSRPLARAFQGNNGVDGGFGPGPLEAFFDHEDGVAFHRYIYERGEFQTIIGGFDRY